MVDYTMIKPLSIEAIFYLCVQCGLMIKDQNDD